MCSFWVRLAPENHNQVNALIERSFAFPETVTVVDPRHPLFDQTFPVLHIKNQHQLVPSCLVQLAVGARRLIPIRVTNLAPVPPDVFPLSIDISSLQNLSATFARIQAQQEMEEGHARSNNRSSADSSLSAAGVGNADGDATTQRDADAGYDLSPTSPGVGTGDEQ